MQRFIKGDGLLNWWGGGSSAQCRLLYLPPYSPDLNKIEKCWSWLKARIRHCIEQFDSLHDAMDSVLKAAS
ncbi:transposase [Limnospira indica PCC 8005]|uniref:Transposase n=1 Tax=Limnospira indica PCC 8005 TaxID=376219 RepID=A0A9P1KAT0_9CYAN|nr:transposase [Limnospira indica PCC 8005]